ncbi:MAG TPA: tetratricopeptide repeat protein [Rhizomicrobium sp.]|jgi:predicted O-linked N-acetylglucosamine transferase (SPINDLY family)|nr:tetratricopeptide repeat protein [Rhizomicrobium sp.]
MEVLDLKAMADQAVSLHRQGDLTRAEALYLQILDADPRLFGPRYYLGLMRLQQGRHDEACDYLGEAVKVFPDEIGALMNYGVALRAAGRVEHALEVFERVLAIQPNIAEALYNRGVTLADLRRFELAVEAYDRALVIQPEMAAAQVNRAVALAAMGRFDDALAGYDRLLAMQPSNVMALNHRGLARRTLGRAAEALADYDRALTLKPDFIEAMYNRGVALLDLERAADALAMFDAVAAAYQNNAEMWSNRGLALWNLKRPDEALASYERALTLEPGFAEAWGNRGLALRDMGRLQEARASFETVLTLEPNNAVAMNSHGNVLRDMNLFDEAINSYSAALQARPNYAEALINRGYAYWSRKQHDAGMADVVRGLKLEPDYPYGRGEVLHARMYSADWHDFAASRAELETLVRAGKPAIQPFNFQAVAGTPADAQACSRIWAKDKYPEVAGRPHDPATRRGEKKIRIGYVSGEFRQQATAILMAGLYERHDRECFEIIAIDSGGNDLSPMRTRLETAFDRWIAITGLSDDQAADVIRDAGIDILVNLNGFFGEARMGVFTRRPAPIQVNYLGFPATLGAAYIDYIIADKVVIPPAEQAFYDEQVVYLPGSYQANDDRGRPMAKTPSRAEVGLPEKSVVFCSFNTAYKLTPDTFDSWMRILKQVDGSVLWLLESADPFAANLRREAQARGVAADRLIFAPVLETDEHLARLGLADMFLDGLPYNAHTTGSDALWAGVPLITRKGTTFPGRVAASLLGAIGLSELVTGSAEEFEALAVKLASDPKALKKVRAKLARNRDKSALFDTDRFRRNIEAAYTQIWERWLAGEKPKGFAVKTED